VQPRFGASHKLPNCSIPIQKWVTCCTVSELHLAEFGYSVSINPLTLEKEFLLEQGKIGTFADVRPKRGVTRTKKSVAIISQVLRAVEHLGELTDCKQRVRHAEGQAQGGKCFA